MKKIRGVKPHTPDTRTPRRVQREVLGWTVIRWGATPLVQKALVGRSYKGWRW